MLNAAQIRVDWKEKKRKFEEDGKSGIRHVKKKQEDAGSKGKDHTSKEMSGEPKLKSGGRTLAIQPGESLVHFNKCVAFGFNLTVIMLIQKPYRRVEDDMRPLVKSAMQTSSAASRNVRKTEPEAKHNKSKNTRGKDPSSTPPPLAKHGGLPKEFQTTSSSAPRRLNDIAQAPPEFKKLPRGASHKATGGANKVRGRAEKLDGVLSMAQKLMMEEEREKAILKYREMKRKRDEGGGESVRGGG